MTSLARPGGRRRRGADPRQSAAGTSPATMEVAAVLLVIAWGTFAFGGVYPWAYWSLAVGCLVVSTGMLLTRRAPLAATAQPLGASLMVLALAVCLQLVPLPAGLMHGLSPAADRMLSEYSAPYALSRATGTGEWFPLSVHPPSTALGLALLATFSLFLLSGAAVFTTRSIRALTRGLLVIGVLMSVSAVIGRAVDPERVYGFWEPMFRTKPFGPFVNPNHFAGWMVMALPLGLGYLAGLIEESRGRSEATARQRLLWWLSPQGTRVVMVSLAALLMTIALLLTHSKAAMGALLVAVGGLAVQHTRKAGPGSRWIGPACFVLLLVTAAGWVGADGLLQEFFGLPGSQLSGRSPAWRDTLAVSGDFWLTGSGLNTFGHTMLFYQTDLLETHFREAHNDYLQLAAEGGLLLGLPILGVIVAFVRAVRRSVRTSSRDPMTVWLRTGAICGLAAIAVQETFEFSLQMPGNAALFCVIAAVTLHQRTRSHQGLPVAERPVDSA